MMVSYQRYNINGGNNIHHGQRDQGSDQIVKNIINGGDSSSSSGRGMVTTLKPKGMAELASQKHALSERKRRKRINSHYDSLRRFFPRLLKADKASVLTETVRRLKELKRMANHNGEGCSGIPSENDESTVSYCDKSTVRAVICCEDRPGLNGDLMGAIGSVRGKPVKAKISTVGGRTKVEVEIEWPESGDGDGDGDGDGGEEDVRMLRRALKAVVENRVLGRAGLMGPGLGVCRW